MNNSSLMRAVQIAFCGLLLVLLVSTAASSASATPAADHAQALTRIDIASLPVEALANVFYAKDKGFFRQQGLDANITILVDPTHLLAALVSREVDFAASSLGGLVVAKSRGLPVKLVASAALYRPLAPTTVLVARRGARIRAPRDLVGKKVAIDSPNAIPHIATLRWLKRNRVTVNNDDFRSLPFPQMLAPLARGEVDAAVIAEPFLTRALQQGATPVANVFKAVCPKICLLTGWIARKDGDPTLTAKFRNAIQAASVWADQKKNRRASGAILAKYAQIDAAVLKKMTRAYFAQRLVPSLAQPWINVYAEFEVIPRSFPAIELVK